MTTFPLLRRVCLAHEPSSDIIRVGARLRWKATFAWIFRHVHVAF